MKTKEGQHLPDDLTSGIAVVEEVERMRRGRVVHERDRQVRRECSIHEPIECRVHAGELILSGSRDEDRHIDANIGERTSLTSVREPPLLRRLRDVAGAIQVH